VSESANKEKRVECVSSPVRKKRGGRSWEKPEKKKVGGLRYRVHGDGVTKMRDPRWKDTRKKPTKGRNRDNKLHKVEGLARW